MNMIVVRCVGISESSEFIYYLPFALFHCFSSCKIIYYGECALVCIADREAFILLIFVNEVLLYVV